MNSVEVIDLSETQPCSVQLFELNLRFELQYHPTLSQFDVFEQANHSGLCIVHTRNRAMMNVCENDLGSSFWENRATQDMTFEAHLTDCENTAEHLSSPKPVHGAVTKAKMMRARSNVSLMIGRPVYFAKSGQFKFAALSADSVLKGGFTPINFKVGLTVERAQGRMAALGSPLSTLEELPETDKDRTLSAAQHVRTTNSL